MKTGKPWLDDPQFGGMSETSARLSYEAWARDGFRKPFTPQDPRPPESDEEIARIKWSIADQMKEYRAAIVAAVEWFRDWKGRQLRGFRAKRQSTN